MAYAFFQKLLRSRAILVGKTERSGQRTDQRAQFKRLTEKHRCWRETDARPVTARGVHDAPCRPSLVEGLTNLPPIDQSREADVSVETGEWSILIDQPMGF